MYTPSAFHQVSSGIRRLAGTARDQLQIHCPSLPENPHWICAGLYRTVSLWADCTTNSWPCNSYSCTAISEASPCYQSDPNSRVLFCWGEATKPKVLCMCIILSHSHYLNHSLCVHIVCSEMFILDSWHWHRCIFNINSQSIFTSLFTPLMSIPIHSICYVCTTCSHG